MMRSVTTVIGKIMMVVMRNVKKKLVGVVKEKMKSFRMYVCLSVEMVL